MPPWPRCSRRRSWRLQANRKTREGGSHPERNAQFEHIHSKVLRFLRRKQPAISVDTKKKELVGDFKNAGREYRPKGQPEPVRVHDFIDKELGKAIPYGVYDLRHNAGWVSVGIDHDTAHFAANTIARWWREMGAARFPKARELLIMADGGGSNSSRSRLWKVALQRLADELDLSLTVCHFPPGTSKWNKIEHRLFSLPHAELAGQAAAEPAGGGRTHQQHEDPDGTGGASRPGYRHLPHRPESQRRGTGPREHHPRHLSRRMELLHSPRPKEVTMLLFDSP